MFYFQSHGAACRFRSSPAVVLKDSSRTELMWQEQDSPELFAATAPAGEKLLAFQAWVSSRTPLRAIGLMENYTRVIKSAIATQEAAGGQAGFVQQLKNNIHRTELIISGQAGKIRSMNCLESLLFETGLNFSPVAEREFRALVLAKSGEKTRIYFSYDRAGVDGGIAASEVFDRRIQEDLAKGFRIRIDLHSHPFSFDNPYGDIGGNLAPSNADLQTYVREMPEISFITNGVQSLEITAKDGELLRTSTRR